MNELTRTEKELVIDCIKIASYDLELKYIKARKTGDPSEAKRLEKILSILYKLLIKLEKSNKPDSTTAELEEVRQ